jgi:aryl-alcohol dehydrogenase-like predicted oxidoreductase
MCISEGMGIAPWGAIGQGSFQRKADQGKSKDGRSAKELSEEEKKVSAALEKVADELKIESVTAVALAWCMSKYPYVYPIIGGRKIESVISCLLSPLMGDTDFSRHLHSNAQALDIHLSTEQVRFLDNVLPFDYGQPQSQACFQSSHHSC